MTPEEMGFDLIAMTKIEKEAMCYRLLVARDAVNEKLRIIQQSLKEETQNGSTG